MGLIDRLRLNGYVSPLEVIYPENRSKTSFVGQFTKGCMFLFPES
jgi:hypothetical protein